MRTSNPISTEGISVVLKAAFTGIKAIPLISIAHNSAFPKLQLFEDCIVSRVIFSRRTNIADIESVDVGKNLFGKQQITIVRKNSLFTFIALPQNETEVFEIVSFFQRKGVLLSVGAQKLYDDLSKN